MKVIAKSVARGCARSVVRNGSNVNYLPEDYWQENDTENYFIEEETNNILTLEDL